MRELTIAERQKCESRRGGFDAFLSERMPVLAEFARALELELPHMIVNEPKRYLSAVDAFMRDQAVRSADLVWIVTRLGYFMGELLIQQFGGCWFLNESPETRFFLRYVVGRFPRIENRNAMVDPFEIARTFVSHPPGRSLVELVRELEEELREA